MKEPLENNPLRGQEQRLRRWIDSLSPRERGELKTAAESPLFCTEIAVRRLLAYLLARRGARHPHLHLQVVYLEVFQRKTVDLGKLRAVFAAAIELIQEYVAWKALRTDRVQRAEYLANHLAGLSDPAGFREALTGWQEALDDEPESLDKFYRQGQLLQTEWSHWATDRYKRGPRVIQRLLHTYEMYDRTTRDLFELGGAMREQLLSDPVPGGETADNAPGILPILCRQAAALNTRPGDAAGFQAFRARYEEQLHRLGPAEREWLLRFCLNYCTFQIHAGHRPFAMLLLELCRWALSQPAFSARWRQSDEDFINLALAFCRPEALPEMKLFIDEHLANLPETSRTQAAAITLAYYHFFNGAFQMAVTELEQIVSYEIPYRLRYHSLRIRAYYELRDFNALESALESYDKYFDRDEWLQDRRRATYVRLAWFVRRFMRLAHPRYDRVARAKAQVELLQALRDPEAPRPVAWEWIEAKIEGMEK